MRKPFLLLKGTPLPVKILGVSATALVVLTLLVLAAIRGSSLLRIVTRNKVDPYPVTTEKKLLMATTSRKAVPGRLNSAE